MSARAIITGLAILNVGISMPGHAADPARTPATSETTTPRPKSDTQPPLPIPPDHANTSGETMKPPTEASMGEVDPKYKSGDPTKPR